ncbi:hypothetical protein PR048_023792 [Dryococelus australis]|uniref:Uncharacterized protein n=1 Tax=Dryococelus australis TaxID=614101 RepID=A0ABQ9GV23_9NEOP|nr:hypothetical protein PR048_023792 [Dryococelus australis]
MTRSHGSQVTENNASATANHVPWKTRSPFCASVYRRRRSGIATIAATQRRTGCNKVSIGWRRVTRAGETGDPRENPPTSGVVWHDSHVQYGNEKMTAETNQQNFAPKSILVRRLLGEVSEDKPQARSSSVLMNESCMETALSVSVTPRRRLTFAASLSLGLCWWVQASAEAMAHPHHNNIIALFRTLDACSMHGVWAPDAPMAIAMSQYSLHSPTPQQYHRTFSHAGCMQHARSLGAGCSHDYRHVPVLTSLTHTTTISSHFPARWMHAACTEFLRRMLP